MFTGVTAGLFGTRRPSDARMVAGDPSRSCCVSGANTLASSLASCSIVPAPVLTRPAPPVNGLRRERRPQHVRDRLAVTLDALSQAPAPIPAQNIEPTPQARQLFTGENGGRSVFRSEAR